MLYIKYLPRAIYFKPWRASITVSILAFIAKSKIQMRCTLIPYAPLIMFFSVLILEVDEKRRGQGGLKLF